MKQAIGKRVTFTLKIDVQNQHISQVYRQYLTY